MGTRRLRITLERRRRLCGRTRRVRKTGGKSPHSQKAVSADLEVCSRSGDRVSSVIKVFQTPRNTWLPLAPLLSRKAIGC